MYVVQPDYFCRIRIPCERLNAVTVLVFKKLLANCVTTGLFHLHACPVKLWRECCWYIKYMHTFKVLHNSQRCFFYEFRPTGPLLPIISSVYAIGHWLYYQVSNMLWLILTLANWLWCCLSPKLFARLHSYGIRGMALQWLNFLLIVPIILAAHCRHSNTPAKYAIKEERKYPSNDCFVWLGCAAQLCCVSPPSMFLVCINELIYILEKFNINVKLFADDVKMYENYKWYWHYWTATCCDILVDWAREWQLSISVDKCCILNIGQQVVTCSPSYNHK